MKTPMYLAAFVLLVVTATSSHLMGRIAEVEDASNAIAPVEIPSIQGQSDEAGPEVKLVLLALQPEGFDSREMQLDPGEYLLIIGNRTGLREVSVRVEREGNGHVAAAAVGGRQRDFKKRFKLTRGTYVVIANDNPDWICRITVGR
jgi:hypothetical protein